MEARVKGGDAYSSVVRYMSILHLTNSLNIHRNKHVLFIWLLSKLTGLDKRKKR